MLTPHGWLEINESRDARDALRVAAVLSRCYPQEAWTARDVERFSNCADHSVKVLTLDDGRIVGSLLYRVYPDAVQIARVAVDARFRRCRIGAFAVRSLTGPTSPERCSVYEMNVHEENDIGRVFAIKCGFTASAISREHFAHDRDAYVFRLFKEAPHRLRQPVSAAG